MKSITKSEYLRLKAHILLGGCLQADVETVKDIAENFVEELEEYGTEEDIKYVRELRRP